MLQARSYRNAILESFVTLRMQKFKCQNARPVLYPPSRWFETDAEACLCDWSLIVTEDVARDTMYFKDSTWHQLLRACMPLLTDWRTAAGPSNFGTLHRNESSSSLGRRSPRHSSDSEAGILNSLWRLGGAAIPQPQRNATVNATCLICLENLTPEEFAVCLPALNLLFTSSA